MEIFFKKLGSEFGIEWTTIRDESASLGNITYKSLFE
jgi:hypothetical protein